MNVMRHVLSVLALSFSVASAHAAAGWDCHDVDFARAGLEVHASNLSNEATSRTPDGGAYQRRELVVGGKKSFHVESKKDYRLRYMPNHPDADSQGMVTVPNIDDDIEIAALEGIARDLKLMGQSGICQTSLLENASSFAIKYSDNVDIISDTFIYTASAKLKEWHRIRKGGSDTLTIDADQPPASSGTSSLFSSQLKAPLR